MRYVWTSAGKLYVGGKDDVLRLPEKKARQVFDIIWNLAEELVCFVDLETPWAKQVICAYIPDFQPPNELFNRQLKNIVAALADNKKVFVHCYGGHGRTGTALAAIKTLLDGSSPLQSLRVAKHYCSGPETREQKKFIINLYKENI